MGQEGFGLTRAKLLGMPLAVKKNEPPYPFDIGMFGADAVMFYANLVPPAVPPAGLLRRDKGSGCHDHVLRPTLYFE
jgi:hypothetical protein